MKSCVRLSLACLALTLLLCTAASAQFSFSLPGKWGNGKRSMGMSRLGACAEPDPNSLMQILEVFHSEAVRVAECLQGGPSAENTKRQMP